VGIHYYRSAVPAAETAALVQNLGQPAVLLQADLRQPAEIERLFSELDKLPYQLAVLVNSAAEMLRIPVMDLTSEDWDAALDLNLRAPLLCSQAAARRMGETGGLIINISDAGTGRTWTGYPAYIVSKAGLEALTRLLARALAPRIRVNAIAPGLILPSEETSLEDWQRLVRRVPMQRAGEPEEVAHTVTFLLHNQYVTGESLAVDGGYRLA